MVDCNKYKSQSRLAIFLETRMCGTSICRKNCWAKFFLFINPFLPDKIFQIFSIHALDRGPWCNPLFTGDPMGAIFACQSSPDTRGADISHLSRVNDVLWCDNWNGSSVSECRNFQYLEHEIEMQEYEGSIMKLLNIRISFRLFWSGGKRARTKLFKPFRRKRLDSSGEFCFYFTSSSII